MFTWWSLLSYVHIAPNNIHSGSLFKSQHGSHHSFREEDLLYCGQSQEWVGSYPKSKALGDLVPSSPGLIRTHLFSLFLTKLPLAL